MFIKSPSISVKIEPLSRPKRSILEKFIPIPANKTPKMLMHLQILESFLNW